MFSAGPKDVPLLPSNLLLGVLPHDRVHIVHRDWTAWLVRVFHQKRGLQLKLKLKPALLMEYPDQPRPPITVDNVNSVMGKDSKKKVGGKERHIFWARTEYALSQLGRSSAKRRE